MAIVFDAATTNTQSTSASSISVSHTVTAGSNMGLVVFVGYLDAFSRNIDSCTYNSVSMTGTAELEVGSSPYMAVRAFYLPAPATGAAYSAAATFSANVVASWIAAVSYSGVRQSSMLGAIGNGNGSSSTPSASLTTTVAGSMVVGGYSIYGGDTDPSTPDDTERWDIATGTSTVDDAGSAGGEELSTAIGSYAISATASASDFWVMRVIEILPTVVAGAMPIFF